MLFTVGITTYKRVELLERCLKSLLKQNCSKEDFQVIVHNDSPTAVGYDYLQKWAESVFNGRLVWVESNGMGLCHARNQIIELSEGDYLCFCDDDDWLRPNHLSTFMEALGNQNKPIVAVNSSIERHSFGSVYLIHPAPQGVYAKEELIRKIVRGNIKSNSFCLPKSSGLRFNPEWEVDENFYFLLFLAELYEFYFSCIYTSVVECRNDSITSDYSRLVNSKVAAYRTLKRNNNSLAENVWLRGYIKNVIINGGPFLSMPNRSFALLSLLKLQLGLKNFFRLLLIFK